MVGELTACEEGETPVRALVVREVEESERRFFADYHAARRYHPTAWKLRLRRDLRVLSTLTAAGDGRIRVRYIDLTLIPSLYFSPRGPDAMFHAFALLDRFWCVTPLGERLLRRGPEG